MSVETKSVLALRPRFRLSQWLRHAVYSIYLVAAVLVGLEIALRSLFGDHNYYWENRYLFASTGAFVNHKNGIWSYAPSQEIRQVAVYGFPGHRYIPAARFRVEYDCRYKTNNLGFIQLNDIHPGDQVTLVLGDSFTEGQGGCPWFYKLEEKLTRTRLLNGGLLGTGLPSWAKLATHITATGVTIDQILIIAIANDFKRGAWNWSKKALDCMNRWECDADEFWQPIHLSESSFAILDRSIARSTVRNANKAFSQRSHELLHRISFAYTYLSTAYSYFRIPKAVVESTVHPDASDALSALLLIDPQLRFLLVPQRDEATTGRKNRDSILVERFLRERSVPFEWCTLDGQHFMPLDSHPNAAGYQELTLCAARLLSE